MCPNPDAMVSVVLPTYDRGPVVGDAIESVLAQTYDRLELLVVDGGSTDGTRAVVESIADPRLRYHRRPEPAGVSAARNLGVAETTGEFVAFVDSDDRWRPDKLERQVTALRRSTDEYAVSYTGIEKADGEPRTRRGTSGDVERAVRRMAVPTYTSTLLVRRRAFEACGGFDESLPCFEDWELCLRLAADYRFRYVDDPLVLKGMTGDNVSADPDRLVDAIRRLRARDDLPDETLGRLLADAGVTCCEAGELRRGRRYLWRALQLHPDQPNAMAALALSLTASTSVFDAAMDRLYALERAAPPVFSRLTDSVGERSPGLERR